MADFPSGIRASTIAWIPGALPLSDHRTAAGNYQPIASTNRPSPARIRLSFQGLNRTQLQTLRNHGMAEGNTGKFLLSPELLDIDDPVAGWASKRWRYVTRPAITDTTENGHSIEFELEEAPDMPWIDRIVLRARTGTIETVGTANLIGPDTLPTIWSSRLTTANNVSSGAYASAGNIAVDADGNSYQAFWFAPSGSTASRVVVVKRNPAGVIQWQLWTSGGLNSVNAGINSYAPAVAPLAGGGCVVAVKRNNATTTADATRAWCIEADSAIRWERDYSLAISGPAQLWHNATTTEIILGTSARNGSSQYVPALVRFNATNGNLIGARFYTVDSNENEFRRMAILPDGSILFLCRRLDFSILNGTRSYLVKLAADFATILSVNGYGTNISTGPTTADSELIILPDGGLLIGTLNTTGSPTVGLLHVSSTYGVLNHHTYPRTGGGFLSGLRYVAAAFDASGNGWLTTLNNQTFSGSSGVTTVAVTSQGGGVDYITEAETELEPSTIGEPAYGANRYQIDIDRQRLLIHAHGGSVADYSCIAQGWALQQPTTTLALDIGSSRNLQGLTTDPAPGSVGAGPVVTRTILAATSGTLSGTASAATLPLSNASGSLSWDYRRIVV
jgi:hypothetical protein